MPHPRKRRFENLIGIMWQEFISTLTDACAFKEPVPLWNLNEAERELNLVFPDHEDDSRTWIASSLKQYIEWSLTGKIKV